MRSSFQSSKSQETSDIYYSPISSIDDSGPSLERHEALVPVWRPWTVVRFQWLDQGGWGCIRFDFAHQTDLHGFFVHICLVSKIHFNYYFLNSLTHCNCNYRRHMIQIIHGIKHKELKQNFVC